MTSADAQAGLAFVTSKFWAKAIISFGCLGSCVFPAIATIKSNNVAASEQVPAHNIHTATLPASLCRLETSNRQLRCSSSAAAAGLRILYTQGTH